MTRSLPHFKHWQMKTKFADRKSNGHIITLKVDKMCLSYIKTVISAENCLITTMLHKSAILFRLSDYVYIHFTSHLWYNLIRKIFIRVGYSCGLQESQSLWNTVTKIRWDIDGVIRIQVSLPSKRFTPPGTVFVYSSQCSQPVCGHCWWWSAWKAAEVPGGTNTSLRIL